MRMEEPLAAGHRQHPPWLGAAAAVVCIGAGVPGLSDDEALQATARAEYGQPRPSNAHWWAAATRCRAAPAVFGQGCAIVRDTLLAGISAVAAPVFDARGHVAAVLTALGASNGFDARPGGSICPGWWKKRPPSAPPWGTHRLPERLNSRAGGLDGWKSKGNYALRKLISVNTIRSMTAPTPATNATFGPSICPAMGRCPVDHRSLPRPPRLGAAWSAPTRRRSTLLSPPTCRRPPSTCAGRASKNPCFSARSWAIGW